MKIGDRVLGHYYYYYYYYYSFYNKESEAGLEGMQGSHIRLFSIFIGESTVSIIIESLRRNSFVFFDC